MTDRHTGYLVTLDKDIREDDAEQLIAAIEMLRGVLNVTPVVSGGLQEMAERQRRDSLWRNALYDLIRTVPAGE
jgi:hypothetical protein